MPLQLIIHCFNLKKKYSVISEHMTDDLIPEQSHCFSSLLRSTVIPFHFLADVRGAKIKNISLNSFQNTREKEKTK